MPLRRRGSLRTHVRALVPEHTIRLKHLEQAGWFAYDVVCLPQYLPIRFGPSDFPTIRTHVQYWPFANSVYASQPSPSACLCEPTPSSALLQPYGPCTIRSYTSVMHMRCRGSVYEASARLNMLARSRRCGHSCKFCACLRTPVPSDE